MAQQESDGSRFVFGPGLCPAPADVESSVRELVPPDSLDVLKGVVVDVSEADSSYHVSVTKDGQRHERTYNDETHDCAQRNRFVAVFVMMTILPPVLATGPEPEAEPEPTEPSTAPPEVPPSASTPPLEEPSTDTPVTASKRPQRHEQPTRAVRLAASALLDYAPPSKTSPGLLMPGAELALGVGNRNWLGTLSLGLTGISRFERFMVGAKLRRLPAHLGLVWRGGGQPISLGGHAALKAEVVEIQGTTAPRSEPQRTLVFGARLGAELQLALGERWHFLVAADGNVCPGPPELLSTPVGEVGKLPHFWVGGRAGLTLSL